MQTLPTDSTWKSYGKKEPYFGVFGLRAFLNQNLTDDLLSEFFASGEEYVENLFGVIHNKIYPEFKPENILDFGCGPGRMIIPFAKNTVQAVGMDISPEMLVEAEKNCQTREIKNVTFLQSDDELKCLEGKKFDLVHSFIVLQHLRVKRGEKITAKLIESIKPGGIGILHFTYYDSILLRRFVNFFRFRIPFMVYLIKRVQFIIEGKEIIDLPQMQMNNYNINLIFSLLQKSGIKDVYTTFTDHHDYWGIVLYFRKDKN